MDLPGGFEMVKFSGEEASTTAADVEPQHIAPNSTMIFHQHIRTCDPASVDDTFEITFEVTYIHPLTFEETTLERTWSFADMMSRDLAPLRKGAAVFSYAKTLRTGKLSSPAVRSNLVAETLEIVTLADSENPGDADLAEIRSVLESL